MEEAALLLCCGAQVEAKPFEEGPFAALQRVAKAETGCTRCSYKEGARVRRPFLV